MPTFNREVKDINLYYLGGLPEKSIVAAMGKAFRLPPPGEFLEVPQHISRALIRRNRDVMGHSAFTTDKEFAKRFIASRNAPPQVAQPPKLSREQLLEMLNDLDEDIQEDVKVAKRNAKKEESV